jgi:hypothetical protein
MEKETERKKKEREMEFIRKAKKYWDNPKMQTKTIQPTFKNNRKRYIWINISHKNAPIWIKRQRFTNIVRK